MLSASIDSASFLRALESDVAGFAAIEAFAFLAQAGLLRCRKGGLAIRRSDSSKFRMWVCNGSKFHWCGAVV